MPDPQLSEDTVEAGVSARVEAGTVVSVSRDDAHRFSKPTVASVTLVEGLGVAGDSHAGAQTQHRFLVKKDPGRVNLTQVHLLQSELFAELTGKGFEVGPGDLGENVTTSGIDLLGLPLGTRLQLGGEAVVEVTGLRSPCHQIDRFRAGLLREVIGRDAGGTVIRKTGIMGIVVTGGTVGAGDRVAVRMPAPPFLPLGVV